MKLTRISSDLASEDRVVRPNQVLWLSWITATRNKSLARVLGVPLVEMKTKKRGLARYIFLTYRTVSLIFRSNARVFVVTNPSVVLAAMMVIYGKLSKNIIVCDTHNVSVIPDTNYKEILQPICNFILKNSDFSILTNNNLVSMAEAMGGSAIAIPDPLPLGFQSVPMMFSGTMVVLCICSWAEDEPIDEIFAAGHYLLAQHPDIQIRITGNPQKRGPTPENLPDNVVLTGFLSDDDFHAQFGQADAIMDLTDREHCLVCGAYEGVAAGRPIIITDSAVSREVFYKGAIYTKNIGRSIANSILQAKLERVKLEEDITMLASEMKKREQITSSVFFSAIAEATAKRGYQ